VEAFAARAGDEVLRLAASLDQVSPHVFAPAIVAAAAARGLALDFPDEVEERAGAGISGIVGGHRVALGRAVWVAGGAPLSPASEAVRRELAALLGLLEERLLPHEEADDAVLYPLVAKAIGGTDPVGPMNREHVEIKRLAGMLARLVDALPERGPSPADLRDLRRVLYGLHAVLRLHFAQEDESYVSLFEAASR
jgi:hypothetical protein